MSKLMDEAINSLRHVPPELQDEVARAVMMLTGGDQPVLHLTDEEKASFAKSRGEAARRAFATDEEIRSTWARHGL